MKLNEMIEIEDVSRANRRVRGKVVKMCPNGVCIDDARGVRFYATFDHCHPIGDVEDRMVLLFAPLQEWERAA